MTKPNKWGIKTTINTKLMRNTLGAMALGTMLTSCSQDPAVELNEKVKKECGDEVGVAEVDVRDRFSKVTGRELRVSITNNTTVDELACAEDIMFDRDCKAIREKAEKIFDEMPGKMECTGPNGIAIFDYKKITPNQLGQFLRVSQYEGKIEGDCSPVVEDYVLKVHDMTDRMECKEGKPYEKLEDGQSKNGGWYNICADGAC